ncbi:MAG: hypothetical protein ACI89X_002413 [Planctomycetota bacterium]|jgi:hypothetical protein
MSRLLAIATLAIATHASCGASLRAQRIPEGAEPNATSGSATLLASGQEAIANLSSVLDEDWFRIVLTATTDLRVQTGPTWSGEIGDTVLTLLDASGGPLRANDDGVDAGYYSNLYAKNLSAGTYYLAVTAGTNAAPTGGYLLDMRAELATSPGSLLIANEGAENNDPRTGGTATNILAPIRCNGDLATTGHAGDWDFWRVLSFGDQMLRIRVAGTANHPNAPADDVVVYLFDGATPPNQVAGPFFASDRDTWDHAIDVRITGGFHHLAVRGVEGSLPGSYYVDLATRAVSTATVFAGGCGGRTLGLPVTSLGAGAPLSLESAFLGMSYSVEGANLGSNGFAFHVVGLAPTFVDLTPFGAIGCALEVVYVDTAFQFADLIGRATWTVAVPDHGSLIGTTLHSQAAVLDLSNPLGITISNRVATTIGN